MVPIILLERLQSTEKKIVDVFGRLFERIVVDRGWNFPLGDDLSSRSPKCSCCRVKSQLVVGSFNFAQERVSERLCEQIVNFPLVDNCPADHCPATQR